MSGIYPPTAKFTFVHSMAPFLAGAKSANAKLPQPSVTSGTQSCSFASTEKTENPPGDPARNMQLLGWKNQTNAYLTKLEGRLCLYMSRYSAPKVIPLKSPSLTRVPRCQGHVTDLKGPSSHQLFLFGWRQQFSIDKIVSGKTLLNPPHRNLAHLKGKLYP